MRVSGSDVLSERTEKSSRFVLSAATFIIFLKVFRINIHKLEFLGVGIPPQLFDTAATVLLIYATSTSLQLWYFDVYIWHNCYKDNKVPDIIEGEYYKGRYVGLKIVHILNQLERDYPEHKSGISQDVNEITNTIMDYNKRLNRIRVHGWLFIFGQHFIFPLCAATYALWSIWGLTMFNIMSR